MSISVFISSTSRDLLDHRKAVVKALLNAGFHPIDMANFMARPERATSACLKEVAESDFFVGIYAWRYGYIPLGAGVSITEQEFLEAERLKKPCFCFVIEEGYTWPEEHKEAGPGARLLCDFKAQLDAKLVRTTFTSPEDLATKMLASLQRWEREQVSLEAIVAQPQEAKASVPAPSSGINISGITGGTFQVGGGMFTAANVGGDLVGRDKAAEQIGGDKLGRDKIAGTSSSLQLSPQEILTAALAQWKQEIEAKIETLADLDPDDKETLKKTTAKIEAEAAKGAEADPGKVSKWLNAISAMAPDILEVTAKTLQNPFAGVGLVLQKINDRINLERQTK